MSYVYTKLLLLALIASSAFEMIIYQANLSRFEIIGSLIGQSIFILGPFHLRVKLFIDIIIFPFKCHLVMKNSCFTQ